MSTIHMLACGMIDYYSPDRGTQKKLRRIMREELAPYGLDLTVTRKKTKDLRTKQSRWAADGFYVAPVGHHSMFGSTAASKDIRAMCRYLVEKNIVVPPDAAHS